MPETTRDMTGTGNDTRAAAFLLLLAALSAGCAAYEPAPLDDVSVEAALAPPDADALKIDAAKIRHPLIEPILFDLKDGLSSREAAVFAVLANPRLRAARDRGKIAEAQLIQAGLLPNPRLSASLEKPTGGLTADTVGAFGLGLDWNAGALLTRGAKKNAARFEKRSVDLAVAWEEWQAAEAARLHWYRLAWKERKLALLGQSEEILRKNLETVRRALAAGQTTALELAAAEAAFMKIRVARTEMEKEKNRERLALNLALGLSPEKAVPLEKSPAPSRWPPPLSKGEVLEGLEDRRLDLVALREGYLAQEEKVRAAVLSQFPAIGIGLIHARDTGDVITTGLSVSIGIPLFDRNQARITAERATRKELFDEYTARLFETRSEVARLLDGMAALRMETAVTAAAVAAKKKLVDTCRNALARGSMDILSYYRAWNDLLDARMKLAALGENLTDLGVALEAASGLILPAAGPGRSPDGTD